jgi:arylsulfatase A-like enzyme
MARRVLFITDDMQRWDTIGAWNGPHSQYAQTPVIDGLARDGVQYWRAYNQNPLCMPSRSTMLSGQYPRTHGSWNNGIALPHDSNTVAQYLKENTSFRTALIGKPHFEPFSSQHSLENSLGVSNQYGPVRGFDTMIVASHDLIPQSGHYTQWLTRNYPQYLGEYYDLLTFADGPGGHTTMNVNGGGDTDAPFVAVNNIPKDLYHTDWVADHTIRWIDSMDPEDDWYCWMSFPDPHHPYDPPASETHRVDWRDIDVDELYGESDAQRAGWLDAKPKHWKWWWTGEKFVSFEAMEGYSYEELLDNPDKIREINAMIHISNSLMDDAIGRVLDHLEAKGWLDDTDIIFTPDHGGLDGDSGLLLIGPALVDTVTRCTTLWKPAASRGVAPADVNAPVGLIDIPATICEVAGVEVPDWMEGRPLPVSDDAAAAQGREHVFTQYESYTPDAQIKMNAVYADGWICNVYERTETYAGTEGELYNVEEDPRQRNNLWNDPAQQGRIADMSDLIYSDLLNRPLLHPVGEPGALI